MRGKGSRVFRKGFFGRLVVEAHIKNAEAQENVRTAREPTVILMRD